MSLDANIAFTLRAAIALLFAAALAHKLRSPAEFEATLTAYLRGSPLAGRGLERPLFVALVALEVLIVAACATPSAYVIAAGAAASTLLLYAAAMSVNLWRGNAAIGCGCSFGGASTTLRPALVLRNLLLALAAAAIALPVRERELAVLDLVSIALATLTAALLYASAERLLAGGGLHGVQLR